jgi:gliding motility-associated lipoprotein GldD
VKRAISYCLLFTACCLLTVACNEIPATPKPRAYPRVIYPPKTYQAFDANYCNFTFQYPTYAQIQQDTTFFNEKPVHPCWFDIYIPAFESRIYCSYYPIKGANSLEKLKKDAFDMVDWHNKKANYIDEMPIHKDNQVSGYAFILDGPAASPMQFYLTDSTHHYLRGALYFNTEVNPDSMAPVYEFVKKDILKMIETFEWKKSDGVKGL